MAKRTKRITYKYVVSGKCFIAKFSDARRSSRTTSIAQYTRSYGYLFWLMVLWVVKRVCVSMCVCVYRNPKQTILFFGVTSFYWDHQRRRDSGSSSGSGSILTTINRFLFFLLSSLSFPSSFTHFPTTTTAMQRTQKISLFVSLALLPMPISSFVRLGCERKIYSCSFTGKPFLSTDILLVFVAEMRIFRFNSFFSYFLCPSTFFRSIFIFFYCKVSTEERSRKGEKRTKHSAKE